MKHENAIVDEGAFVGEGTNVWAFSHIQAGAKVGTECNIGECVFIESGAVVGNNVTIKNGVQIWDGIIIEDNVFVGPNVTFCNDKFPRSKQHLVTHPVTRLCRGASLGANATILPGINIGIEAMVGAGSVVTRDVSSKSVVVGNPACPLKHKSSTYENSMGLEDDDSLILLPRHVDSLPICLTKSPVFVDRRGKLTFTEYDNGLPWKPMRMFVVYDTPEYELRGHHAHKTTHQCLVCVNGCIKVLVDNGIDRTEVKLDSPSKCLMVPPMVWSSQHYIESGSVGLRKA